MGKPFQTASQLDFCPSARPGIGRKATCAGWRCVPFTPRAPGHTGSSLVMTSGVLRTALSSSVFEKTIAATAPGAHTSSYLKRSRLIFHAMRAQRESAGNLVVEDRAG